MNRRQALQLLATTPVTLVLNSETCDQCRYLGEINDKPFCHKLVPQDKKDIDEMVADYLKYGDDSLTNRLLRDGCPGKML